MKRLVSLVLGTGGNAPGAPGGEVRDDLALLLLEHLTRAELKGLLAALRRELKRRRVTVEIAGDPGPAAGEAMARRYPGRTIEIGRNESLGAGLRISAGDDIVDASMRGYIRQIIEELGGT